MSKIDPSDEKLKNEHVELNVSDSQPEIVEAASNKTDAEVVHIASEFTVTVKSDDETVKPWKRSRKNKIETSYETYNVSSIADPRTRASSWSRVGAFLADEFIMMCIFYTSLVWRALLSKRLSAK